MAEALAKASGVSKVHYPGLASHSQHELARRQMLGGFGGMMSFEVAGPTAEERFKRAQGVLRNVRLCISAASLGGTETLITHPASMIFSHPIPTINLLLLASSRACCGYPWVSSITRISWTISRLRFRTSGD